MVIFAVIIVFAVLVFGQVIPIGKANNQNTFSGNVTIWGTLPSVYFERTLQQMSQDNQGLEIAYTQKNPETFEDELIRAFAVDGGPDLFILPQSFVFSFKDKITPLSYQRVPRQVFQNSYIDSADILLADEGVLGLPILIDPLVTFYNKNLLASDFLVAPPEYWDEYYVFSEKVTKAQAITINTSAVALGTFDNINNAKDILSALFLQTRNPIVEKRSRDYVGVLSQNYVSNFSNLSASTLEFFTSFSDTTKSHYSWNSAMVNSRDAFIREQLAVYFGYSSEARDLMRLNPNINVGVAILPQLRDLPKTTFANIHTMMLSRTSKDPLTAVRVMQYLTSRSVTTNLANGLGMPPVFIADLATNTSKESYIEVFYNSAIISKTWIDPDSNLTKEAFRRMIRDVNSGVIGSSGSIIRLNQAITELFPRSSTIVE